ncbi:hypothetical protein COU19_01280 [Candidatus Kaiserbacteria bacterium CG10_big_fil_rev_8_21_14_0_10_56_12]|uniref:Glycosyltransferase subfamily 4-like N-terminal domain-containing protein n=1 Tax=Candidatus Kaiserbacteria bacterium CG10_big_fil_rev_8_21_14_0_10_56_12 TaxID=1974611 RepID=A0A2H0UA52_9BACT|nr:MAG: hypothetical protein COU19_01280 [Candidatus Kaiserbacteria bacterium CG10_big_fil_rev_8_21_14_0_10_56_12]
MGDLSGTKILYVITKSNWGGAQAQVYTLASHYAALGAEVAVALGGTGAPGAPTGRLAEELRGAVVRTLFLPTFARDVSVLRELRAFRDLYRLLRSERPHVVHLHSSKAGGLGALASRCARVPNIVFTSHGLAYDEDRPPVTRALIKLATWATFVLCHSVIAISQDTYTRARRLPFCASRVRLIYNGITPQALIEREAARSALLPRGVTSNTIWIGTISEFTRNKGLTYLVRAARLMKTRGVAFVLCIIGTEGDEREMLEQLVVSEGLTPQVHFLGFVPEAARYLRAFDIFTLTSVKEGLPYVLLEAGVSSCAVVGSRIPGITDIVDDEHGVLVPPKDPSAIALACADLATNKERRDTLGQALHARVLRDFSHKQMFQAITAIYRAR